MTAVVTLACAVGAYCAGQAALPAVRRRAPPAPPSSPVPTDSGPGRGAARRPRHPLHGGPLARRRLERARHRAALDLPDALELVVLAVRAGHLPAAAVRCTLTHLPPSVRGAFADVVDRVDGGERFGDAVASLVDHLGDDAVVLADTFAAADRYGLPLTPLLERLADDARRRRRRHAESLARQLPVRLSLPLVLCTLPSFVLLAVVPLLVAALSSLEW